MSHGGGDSEDGKLDLVPLIDTVMLLLMFFILTSKFTSEEKSISSLLPTDKGQMASTPTQKVEEPKQINICIYPAGMEKGYQPSGYRDQLQQYPPGVPIPAAAIRIGGGDPIIVENATLAAKDGVKLEQTINSIHQFIGEQLEARKIDGADRKDQIPVIISCFSGMSWRYALLAYDAVRYYEAKNATFKYTGDPNELTRMREVTFAPPRIRNYSANELGNELFEIIHMK
jgi:hypothetical protein